MYINLKTNKVFGLLVLGASFLLLATVSYAQDNAGKVETLPPPVMADASAPAEIEADHAAVEASKPTVENLQKDPLFQKMYEARLAKVEEIAAVSKKITAQANADAKKALKGEDIPNPITAPMPYPNMAAGQNAYQMPISQPVVDKPKVVKPDDSVLDRVKVVMIVGDKSTTLNIGGSQNEFKVGDERNGITVTKINAEAQLVQIKHLKSGRTKSVSMDDSEPFPTSNLQPIKDKDKDEKQPKKKQ